eukprot:m.68601 g.68601  ORF g.68601 m.68601 type:complete len:371 (-) comp11982_c0_seq1:39-1151(-)
MDVDKAKCTCCCSCQKIKNKNSPSLETVSGQLKAARAEIIKLQRSLTKAQKEFTKQLADVEFVLNNRIQKTISKTTSKNEKLTKNLISPTSHEAEEDTSLGWLQSIKPIGYLQSCFVRKNGTPRQGGLSTHARASLKLQCFSDASPALEGLHEYSHVWVLFVFHQNNKASAKPKVAPPRVGTGPRVGVFSTRSPHRPNSIGLSLARVGRITEDTVHLDGLDVLDGTPILDIKPYIPLYDNPQNLGAEVRIPEWLAVTQNPSLDMHVEFTQEAEENLCSLESELVMFTTAEEAKACIIEILTCDPRSVYRKTKCAAELYPLCLDTLHIVSEFQENNVVQVQVVERLADTPYAEETSSNLPPRLVKEGLTAT